MMPSIGQLLLVLAIVLVIFGAKRVPSMMKDLGQGMKSFRDGMKESDKEPEKLAQVEQDKDKA